MAKELDNEEILSHTLNNVGTVQMFNSSSEQKGVAMLQQSLEIALKNSYHEHAASAYTNLVSSSVRIKKYAFARKALERYPLLRRKTHEFLDGLHVIIESKAGA